MDKSLVLKKRNLHKMFFDHGTPIRLRDRVDEQSVDTFSIVHQSFTHMHPAFKSNETVKALE